jgi:hypothetical protein
MLDSIGIKPGAILGTAVGSYSLNKDSCASHVRNSEGALRVLGPKVFVETFLEFAESNCSSILGISDGTSIGYPLYLVLSEKLGMALELGRLECIRAKVGTSLGISEGAPLGYTWSCCWHFQRRVAWQVTRQNAE